MKNLNFTIVTFYQFKKVNNIINIKKLLREFCLFNKIKGTIILAEEGINGTVSGLNKPIDLLEKKLTNLKFLNLEKKKSFYNYMPFNRLKIKIKNEIVTFNEENLDVEKLSGKHINSSNWNDLINKKETILVDVRNDFEVQIGTFKDSINPNTKNFSEFKSYLKENLNTKKNNNIAMFCTGGIRCEKASAYMVKQGYKNVYQLKGGILQYLKDTSKNKSKWEGECFVFDNRVSIRNEMKSGTYELCHACRNPISLKNMKSKYYEKGISCPKCINKTSKIKKQNLKERNKQIEIAKKKGLYNPFIKYTPSDFS